MVQASSQSFQSTQGNNPQAEAFEALLNTYGHGFERGLVVPALVMGYEGNGVVVDIGAKTLAILPPREVNHGHTDNIPELLPVGSKLDVYVMREDDHEERFIVSRKRVSQARTWEELADLLKNDGTLHCVVTGSVKGGVLVDVQGLRGFVPASHLRIREDISEIMGKELPLKIINLDPQNNNLILSHKKVVQDQVAEQRKDVFGKLEVGTLVEGDIVRLTDFGAFVDLGGIDGLLPLSQMSWRWVEHPSDLYKIGDKVTVEIIGVDPDRGRISLSIKSQYQDPWNEVSNALGYGDKVEGTLTRIKHFGAFVEVYPGVEALLPSKEMADYESANSIQLKQGDRIAVYIAKFQPEERRIALSFNLTGEDGAGEYTPVASAPTEESAAV
ncbi:MAG: S1 RNA-binding domain-containing protein [Vampirovibrionales bacterium]|nr:S1 RNA-binding domain-containing protein [Vampirovibrionales bacterium]